MIRSIILFTTLFIAVVLPCSAQPYSPMLGDSSIWYTVDEFQGIYNWSFYFAAEDTVMDNKTYKFLDGFHFNKNVFLREDTAARKVYYRQKKGFKANEDVLMYDFSLQPGDSMLLFNPNTTLPDSAGYFILDSISEIDLLDGKHRSFHLSKSDGSDRAYWIEGVGSKSLVNSSSGLGNLPNYTQLSCFYKDGIHIYESDLANAFGTCEIITVGIEEISPLSVTIFPNPVINSFQVSGDVEKGSVQINDLMGKVLKTWSVEPNLSYDIGDLPTGQYIMRLTDGKQVVVRKVIKK